MSLFDHAEIVCCNCGTIFGIANEVYKLRKDDRKLFWCPNGHEQFFPGKSKKDKKIDQLVTDKIRLQQELDHLELMGIELNREHKFKCPFAHCTWGTNTKFRMRDHLGDKHKMQSIPILLPPTAGSDAHGDMGIS